MYACNIYYMKRTSLFIEDELERDIKMIARIEGKTASEVIREALREYVKRNLGKRNLSIVGIGRSGRSDISESHEDNLWERS